MRSPVNFSEARRRWGVHSFLAASAVIFANACAAQVALDRPVSIGSGDKVYLSSSDPKTAYLFPYALIIKTEPRIAKTQKVLTVHFTAGVDADYIAAVQKEVTKVAPGVTVRMFRGMNSTVLPNSITDIGPEFTPVLVPLGEAADFGRDVEYALTVRRKRCWFLDRTSRSINETFKAKQPRNVGVIEYSFTAVAGNQTMIGKTAIPLFVGGK